MTLDNIQITPLLDTLRLEKISDREYFSKKYNGYISNSRLNLIDPKKDGSPEKFFDGIKPFYSDSLILGSIVHEITLQEDLFEVVETVDRPTAKLGFIADELYPIYLERNITNKDICDAARKIEYYGGVLSQNKIDNVKSKCFQYLASRREFEKTYKGNKELIYADPKIREKGRECIIALKNNRNIQKLLHPSNELSSVISENEKAILLDIKVNIENKPEFILKLKAKLDNYTIDTLSNEICVNDVKTTSDIVSNFDNAIIKFNYYREMAIYSWLLSLCAKKFYNIKNPIIKSNFLVVQTRFNYYTKIVPITKKLFIFGFEEFKYLLKLVINNFEFYSENPIFTKIY